jgi:hypothetical protein
VPFIGSKPVPNAEPAFCLSMDEEQVSTMFSGLAPSASTNRRRDGSLVDEQVFDVRKQTCSTLSDPSG